MTAFGGLRVLDLTTRGLRLAGVFLADFGADVIAVSVRPDAGEFGPEPAEVFWRRGKRTVSCDPRDPRQLAAIIRLAGRADVIIQESGEMAGCLAIEYDQVSAQNPGVVQCQISAFGAAPGPQQWGPRELIVAAKSGRLLGRDRLSGAHEDMSRPVYAVPPIGTYGAAMLAVQGIIAGLIRREATGRGARLDTSVLDGISAATMRLAFERQGDAVIPSDQRANGGTPLLMLGIRLCFLTVQCADGKFIQMCCRQPHLFRNWMRLIGLADELAQERWAALPLGVRSAQDAQLWEQKIRRAMQNRSQDGWMELFRAADIGADPFLTESEFLAHPQMLANDRIAQFDDPLVGAVTMVGPLVLASGTPAWIRPGADAGDISAIEWARTAAAPGVPGASASGDSGDGRADSAGSQAGAGAAPVLPLAGYTILEAATYLAAPLGPTLLAALGARVIKVEPLEGDSFRSSGLEFVHISNGKESVALDLKTPEGREILVRLVGMADALIHNFRPGVPERLGLDYDSVHRLNPRLAYVYGSSYGSRGPERQRAAFHSTPNALSGGGIAQAGAGNPPVNDSYPDPVAGLAAGAALALGLFAALRSGSGQYLETSMLTSTGWALSSRLVEYPGRPPRPQLDAGQLGFDAFRRLYESADGWILLDVRTDADVAALAAVLGDTGSATLATVIGQGAGTVPPAAAASELAALFGGRGTAEWERLALSAGLPLVSAADMSFEEFLVRHALVSSADHPVFGSYWRLRDRIRLAGDAGRDLRACAVGEHTARVLSELGYSDASIAQMAAAGVIGLADMPAQIGR